MFPMFLTYFRQNVFIIFNLISYPIYNIAYDITFDHFLVLFGDTNDKKRNAIIMQYYKV